MNTLSISVEYRRQKTYPARSSQIAKCSCPDVGADKVLSQKKAYSYHTLYNFLSLQTLQDQWAIVLSYLAKRILWSVVDSFGNHSISIS